MKKLLWFALFACGAWLTFSGSLSNGQSKRGCRVTVMYNANAPVYTVHRFELQGSAEVNRQPVLTSGDRGRAKQACRDYISGKPVAPAVRVSVSLR
jgi:hypothetical protein